MRNQAHSTVYKRPHQSRFTALMCLLLCVTLNVQWLASTATWTQRNPVTVPQQNALYIPTTQTARTATPAIGTITQVNPPKGSTTLAIRTVQPNTLVPNNALFKVNTNPGKHALIETDPRFADYKTWINSDVLIAALGQQPDRVLQRLGDGFYEQKLVQEQIIAATGQRFTGDYTSNEAQYKALLLSGAEFANSNRGLNLSLGVALTEAQMRNLTTDIVWLVEQTITLPNGQTAQALVPQVYLRVKEGDLKGDGSLIAARDINLNLSGDLNNSGTIAGRNSTFINAENINNSAKDPNNRDTANVTALGGRITGNVISLTAKQDPSTGSGGTINNLGGQILGTQADGQSASQAYLSAGRDINVASTTQSTKADTRGANGPSTGSGQAIGTLSTRTAIDQVGTIQAGNVAMFAGRDLSIAGASVSATSGNLILSADRNVKLAAIDTAEQTNINFGSNRAGGNTLNQGSTTQVGSQLGAAGQVYISAGRQAVEGQVAKPATYNPDGSLKTPATEAVAAQARSTGNVSSTGATIQAGGLVTINATGNIELLAAKNTSNFAQETSSYSKGFLSKSSSNTKTATQASESAGTTISGGAIAMNAGIGAPRDTTGATGNITAQGANLVADGDINIRAANNITLTTAQNTQDSQNSSVVKNSGFTAMQGGINVGYSANKTATTGNSSEVTNTGTSVGSIGGNINIQAGNALKVEGSTITAAAGLAGAPTANTSNNTNNSNNTSVNTPDSAVKTTPVVGQVTLSGASVAILDVQNTTSSSSTYDNKTSGITVGVSIGALGAITGVQSAAKNLATVSGSSSGSSATDTRMQAMGAAVAANNLYQGASALATSAGNIANGGALMGATDKGGGGVGITVSASVSKTSSSSQTNTSTSQGSSITGTNVSVSATGKDLDGNAVDKSSNAQSGNLLVQGSKVAGTAATSIAATGDIALLAGQSTSTTTTNNASKSAGASVSFSMAGVPTGGGVNASKSNGNSNEQFTTYTNTQIGNGGNSTGTGAGTTGTQSPNSTLSITSGGNTTMTGAVASANQVSANVGGNLSITSVQDTYSYKDSSKSVGVGVSYSAAVAATAAAPAKDAASGASITLGKSNTNATYSAVTEQSGIKAGDAGFQVSVGGQTVLTGAVIASTDKAVNTTVEGKDANGNPQGNTQTKPLNQFTSAGGVTATDLTNTSSYKASSASITAGVGSSLSSSGAGIGNAKGNETSTTQSGISGVTTAGAGNAAVRTDDKAPVLANTFAQNKDAIKANIAAQVQITQAFGQQAPKMAADYADSKKKDLEAQAKEAAKLGTPEGQAKAAELNAEASKWAEGGNYRVAIHSTIGFISGGTSGALGAGATAAVAPTIDELQSKVKDSLTAAGLPAGAATAISQLTAQGTALAIGSAAGAAGGGGSSASLQGAAMGFNIDSNNRQLHPSEAKWIKDNARAYAKQNPGMTEAEAEKQLADQAFRQVQFGAEGLWNANAQAFLKTAGTQQLPTDPSSPNNGPGFMFYATPAQKADATMYLSAVLNDPQTLKFYQDNKIKQPTIAQITQATGKDGQSRNELAALTIKAAAAAGGLALAPALSGVAAEAVAFIKNPVAYCTANPMACVAGVDVAAATTAGVPMTGASLPAIGRTVTGVPINANWAQTEFNAAGKFSSRGAEELSQIAGRPISTIEDLTAAIKSGVVNPSQIPVEYAIKDGQAIILNTRTATALERAGIPRAQWAGSNVSEDAAALQRLQDQLDKNRLPNPNLGTPTAPTQGRGGSNVNK